MVYARRRKDRSLRRGSMLPINIDTYSYILDIFGVSRGEGEVKALIFLAYI